MTAHRSSAVRRREIADVALAIFGETGLTGLTIAAIAKKVGVTDAALFRHFGSKHDVISAAIDRAEEILFQGFPPSPEDPLDRLGEFFRARVRALRENPGVAKLMMSEHLAEVAPWATARLQGFRRRSQRFVRARIDEAGAKGMIGSHLAPGVATVLVLGAIMALAHGPVVVRVGQPSADAVWNALERALFGPGEARPGPRSGSGRRAGRQQARRVR